MTLHFRVGYLRKVYTTKKVTHNIVMLSSGI